MTAHSGTAQPGPAQAPILTVTLNPALDIATATDSVVPEIKLRCDAPQVDPGGGGINVSRAIDRIGGRSTALVALGGGTGVRLATQLAEAGLAVLRLEAPGDTRFSLSVTDRGTGQQFRFVLPGPQWGPLDVRAALDALGTSAPTDGLVVLSGSNPPGVPPAFAAMAAARLAGTGSRLVVDTSGAALAAVAAARDAPVELLRMDDVEAAFLAGAPLPTRADTADFAARLAASGAARTVIVARGSDGNIIATPEGRWHVAAHRVPVVSKVGAGDSFVAGYVLGLARHWSVADALGLGAAAASATVMTPASDLCHPADVERLFAEREVTPV